MEKPRHLTGAFQSAPERYGFSAQTAVRHQNSINATTAYRSSIDICQSSLSTSKIIGRSVMNSLLRNQKRGTFLASIRKGWRNWRARRNALAELHQSTALESVARDLNLSPQDLQAVTAKWPTGSDLLNERMTALRLDPERFSPAELGALRDAQRVCSICGSKSECKHDLAESPTSGDWRSYCPNVDTLVGLQNARWFAPLKGTSRSSKEPQA